MTSSYPADAVERGLTSLGIEFGSTRIKAVLIGAGFSPITSGSYEWENSMLMASGHITLMIFGQGYKPATATSAHLDPSGMHVLGAHMLEICPSIADDEPSLEVHPLVIGGKANPARLVFNTPAEAGIMHH